MRKWVFGHKNQVRADPSTHRLNLVHCVNRSTQQATPQTPFDMEKGGVYKGIHRFSYFGSKLRFWMLVRTAALRWFQ